MESFEVKLPKIINEDNYKNASKNRSSKKRFKSNRYSYTETSKSVNMEDRQVQKKIDLKIEISDNDYNFPNQNENQERMSADNIKSLRANSDHKLDLIIGSDSIKSASKKDSSA